MAVATNGRRRRKEMEAAKEDAKEQQVAENALLQRKSQRTAPDANELQENALWKKRKTKKQIYQT
jgi:hypothetical protein